MNILLTSQPTGMVLITNITILVVLQVRRIISVVATRLSIIRAVLLIVQLVAVLHLVSVPLVFVATGAIIGLPVMLAILIMIMVVLGGQAAETMGDIVTDIDIAPDTAPAVQAPTAVGLGGM